MTKKELNQEQLDKVSGGYDEWDVEHSQYLPANHGRHIGKDEARNFVGSDIYVVDDARPWLYCWGTLTSSNGSYHSVTIKGKSDSKYDSWFEETTVEAGDNHSFRGSVHTLYLFS